MNLPISAFEVMAAIAKENKIRGIRWARAQEMVVTGCPVWHQHMADRLSRSGRRQHRPRDDHPWDSNA